MLCAISAGRSQMEKFATSSALTRIAVLAKERHGRHEAACRLNCRFQRSAAVLPLATCRRATKMCGGLKRQLGLRQLGNEL